MDYFWLCISALAAGIVNAVAGGGTLLTFPPLETTLSTIDTQNAAAIANATSTVALFPGTVGSVWGYRKQVIACKRWILVLAGPSLIGGILGAMMVGPSFRLVIPWLILIAAILFMLQPTIARLLKPRSEVLRTPGIEPHPGLWALVVISLGQFLIGVYGGYFGAGIGILMLSSLSFLGLKDIHETNALKSFLAMCMNMVAAVIFVAKDMVHWQYAIAMAISAIVGGYFGARYALLLKPVIVRWVVIVIGFSLAAYYFFKL